MLESIKKRIPAVVHLLFFFWGSSRFAELIFPPDKVRTGTEYLNRLVVFVLFGTLFYQLLYTLVYVLEPKFLDKYKANELEWPWKQNPKAFKKNIWKYILNHVNLLLFC